MRRQVSRDACLADAKGIDQVGAESELETNDMGNYW